MTETTDVVQPVEVTPIPLISSIAWKTFARQVRAVNHRNGWGTDFKPTDIPGAIALIHSEITEAVEESTPQLQACELADVVIRGLDLAEQIAPGHTVDTLWMMPGNLYTVTAPYEREHLLELHSLCSPILEHYRKINDWEAAQTAMLTGLHRLRVRTFFTASTLLLDTYPAPATEGAARFEHMLWEKLQKNAGRGYRHGGRRI